MATLKSIALSQIFISPDRARPVDLEHAAAIACSMVDRGLINPITVRPTPAANGGKTPYTLVAGGHRLEAARMNGWEEIDALVVSTDAAEAQLIEISENVFRNELSKLDRAIFVMKFREIYEEKHGKITRGGDRKSKPHDAGLIFSPGRALSAQVKERLGFGEDAYERATKIGLRLAPLLRSALRGTRAENDQKLLLKLAGMPETEQAAVLGALKIEPDVYKALAILKPEKPQADPQAAALKKLLAAWTQADEETRGTFLAQIGIDPLDVPDAITGRAA